MGIDRLGKGGPPAAPPDVGQGVRGSERVRGGGEIGKTFEAHLQRTASDPAAPATPKGLHALEQLRAGQIDFDRYLDLKVEGATAHLRGLRPAELAEIQATLRQQIASDPALAELVQHATGQAPAPKE